MSFILLFFEFFYLGEDIKREGDLCVLVREVLGGFCLFL